MGGYSQIEHIVFFPDKNWLNPFLDNQEGAQNSQVKKPKAHSTVRLE